MLLCSLRAGQQHGNRICSGCSLPTCRDWSVHHEVRAFWLEVFGSGAMGDRTYWIMRAGKWPLTLATLLVNRVVMVDACLAHLMHAPLIIPGAERAIALSRRTPLASHIVASTFVPFFSPELVNYGQYLLRVRYAALPCTLHILWAVLPTTHPVVCRSLNSPLGRGRRAAAMVVRMRGGGTAGNKWQASLACCLVRAAADRCLLIAACCLPLAVLLLAAACQGVRTGSQSTVNSRPCRVTPS
jgi:hypothetical protein